jgi:GNAT superfamily N-acetyltransferase
MNVINASTTDVDSWLAIVRETEPLFGAMPGYQSTLLRKINEGNAICVHDFRGGQGREVAGAALLGGTAPVYWILWLAVRAVSRNRGIGSALVSEALRRFQPLRRRQDDHCTARPADPSLRHHRNRQRQLPLQAPRLSRPITPACLSRRQRGVPIGCRSRVPFPYRLTG